MARHPTHQTVDCSNISVPAFHYLCSSRSELPEGRQVGSPLPKLRVSWPICSKSKVKLVDCDCSHCQRFCRLWCPSGLFAPTLSHHDRSGQCVNLCVFLSFDVCFVWLCKAVILVVLPDWSRCSSCSSRFNVRIFPGSVQSVISNDRKSRLWLGTARSTALHIQDMGTIFVDSVETLGFIKIFARLEDCHRS